MSKMTAQEILGILENIPHLTVGKYATLEEDFEDSDNYYSGWREDDEKPVIPEEFITDELIELAKAANTRKSAVLKRKAKDEFEGEEIYKIHRTLPNYHEFIFLKYLESQGLGEIITVEQKGGSDEGSDWYVIRHFVEHDVYIKTSGWYSSYEGTSFSNGWGNEVKPEQVTVTRYRLVR